MYKRPFIEYKGKQFDIPHFGRSCKKTMPLNLVYCFDGTGAEFGYKPFTNVLKLFKMLQKDDPNQLCYYQPGIGVQFKPDSYDMHDTNFVDSKLSKITNSIDAMIAFTLKQHVIAAYMSLCRFYNKGDKIFLFGFSRGSFTARVLAGMIEKVGLLNNGLEDMASTAWKLYSNWEYSGQPAPSDPKITMIEQFRETFSRNDIEIEFMGLWDSVNSVGIIIDRLFPFTTSSSIVKHIRHALSMDERRAKFKQVMISQQCDSECDQSSKNTSSSDLLASSLSNIVNQLIYPAFKHPRDHQYYSDDVIEMFFPGDHGDCGGGWSSDSEGGNLSDISFRWMILEVFQFGIIFKPESIHQFEENYPLLRSLFSYHHDMLSKLPTTNNLNNIKNEIPSVPIRRFASHGEMSIIPTILWWSIELLPVQYKYEKMNGEWKRILEPNLGGYRVIPTTSFIHWSFFYRLHFVEDYNYNPNICLKSVGEHMLRVLQLFKALYKGILLEEYCRSLSIDEIRNDWTNDIWKIIPNDLQKCLDKDPKI